MTPNIALTLFSRFILSGQGRGGSAASYFEIVSSRAAREHKSEGHSLLPQAELALINRDMAHSNQNLSRAFLSMLKESNGIEIVLLAPVSDLVHAEDRRYRRPPCDIVSPSSIPSPRGKAIKTDRIDAGYLAQFYANDLLTIVQPPDAKQEQDPDLLRSRQKVLQQRTQLRKHLQAVLRRNGLHYKAQTGNKSHWTKHHYFWLARTIDGLSGSLKVNLELLLRQLKALNEVLTEYGQQIEELAGASRYQQAVQSLTCYKGIKHIFALTMITEIGDIKRFPHPRQLMSWIGMDIREYSSGGKHNHFGITKHGNRYLRTAFVEANQRGYRTARIGKDLKARRKDTAPELIHIADRCLRRLNKKGNRLLLAGKHPNKVKVACAREMVGFVWESLNAVAA